MSNAGSIINKMRHVRYYQVELQKKCKTRIWNYPVVVPENEEPVLAAKMAKVRSRLATSETSGSSSRSSDDATSTRRHRWRPLVRSNPKTVEHGEDLVMRSLKHKLQAHPLGCGTRALLCCWEY